MNVVKSMFTVLYKLSGNVIEFQTIFIVIIILHIIGMQSI